jgi:hypothetical protein
VRVVLAALLMLAACSSGGATPRWTDGTVTIVGDSMVFEAGGQLEELASTRGWKLTIDAIPGTTFADHRDEIADLADRRESAVVVELGTNDALGDGDFTDGEARDVDRAVEDLRDVGCVLFVNAGLLEPGNYDVLAYPPWDDYEPGLRAAQSLNRHLRAAVAEHRNQHVFDWYAAYNRNAGWTRDFVHLRDEYHDDYARLVLDALSDACGPGTTPS